MSYCFLQRLPKRTLERNDFHLLNIPNALLHINVLLQPLYHFLPRLRADQHGTTLHLWRARVAFFDRLFEHGTCGHTSTSRFISNHPYRADVQGCRLKREKCLPPHNHISSLSLFRPSKCLGLAPRRLSSAPLKSGTMTSHSCRGAEPDAIVRVRTCVRRGMLRKRGRRASIRYAGAYISGKFDANVASDAYFVMYI